MNLGGKVACLNYYPPGRADSMEMEGKPEAGAGVNKCSRPRPLIRFPVGGF